MGVGLESDWEDYYYTKADARLSIPSLFIVAIAMVAFVIWVTAQLFMSELKKTMDKFARVAVILNLTFNTTFIFLQMINYAIAPITESFTAGCFARQTNSFFLAMGRLTFYLVCLSRVHTTFHNSDLAYNTTLLKTIGVLCSITAVTSALLYITLVAFVDHCNGNWDSTAVLYAAGQDFIWSVVLLTMFLRQLFVTVRRAYENESFAISGPPPIVSKKTTPDGRRNTGLKMKNTLPPQLQSVSTVSTARNTSFNSTRARTARFVFLMTKLTVVTTVAIFSTWIVVIFFTELGPLMYSIDTMVNTSCMVLSFSHFDQYYMRLCFACRLICERPCVLYAKVDEFARNHPTLQVRGVSKTRDLSNSSRSAPTLTGTTTDGNVVARRSGGSAGGGGDRGGVAIRVAKSSAMSGGLVPPSPVHRSGMGVDQLIIVEDGSAVSPPANSGDTATILGLTTNSSGGCSSNGTTPNIGAIDLAMACAPQVYQLDDLVSSPITPREASPNLSTSPRRQAKGWIKALNKERLTDVHTKEMTEIVVKKDP